MNDILHAGGYPLPQGFIRPQPDSWELIYCTRGSGAFRCPDATLVCGPGDVLVIPPAAARIRAEGDHFEGLQLRVASLTLALSQPTVISDGDGRFLLDAFRAAQHHFHSRRRDRAAFLACYGTLIAHYLKAYQPQSALSGVVRDIENHIIANYANSDYRLGDYLQSLPFSYDYLRKLFQKELGMTPHRYLIDKRLETAAGLLLSEGSGGASVADIAQRCGFREPLYFSRMFKQRYGVAPSYYPASREPD